jgi:hypothetical protein
MALDLELVRGQLLAVLGEARHGPPDGYAYFSDRGPGAGWHALLAGISADDAARAEEGASVATEVHHLAFGLRAVAAFLRGEWTPGGWAESWEPRAVDPESWAGLQAELGGAFEAFEAAIADSPLDRPESFGGALGGIAHVAYHLGAIRERLRTFRTAG